MINVNTATKNSYLQDSGDKQFTVSFPNLGITLTNSDLNEEDFEWTEYVLSGENIEFVGCNSAFTQFTVNNVTDDVKDEYVEISITCDNTEPITLFTGYVDGVEQVPHKTDKKITAYDKLYKLTADKDVSNWYKTLSFPITGKDFRDGLFSFLGITQETTALLFDSISFKREWSPSELSGLNLIKAICQFNARFGRIGRDGLFHYVVPPQNPTSVNQAVDYYKDANYQEYTIKPVDKVVIHTGEKDYIYGGGQNRYVINNNFFAKNLDDTTLNAMAQNIYNAVHNFVFQPFECDINALPYIECLDVISLPVKNLSTDVPVITPFCVLNRTIKGIQALRDTMRADGDQYQHEFVTDLNLNLDELRQALEVIKEDLEDAKIKYYLLTNNEDIDIDDNEEKTIIDLRFQSRAKTIAIFHAEILLEAETTVSSKNYYDALCQVSYFWNSEEIADYAPVETYVDGKHILHLLYYFNIPDSGMNHFEVKMKMNGGSVHINTAGIRGCMYGQNLYATEDFDGIIEITEYMTNVTSALALTASASMTENISMALKQTSRNSLSEDMSNVAATLSLTVTGTITETVSVITEE